VFILYFAAAHAVHAQARLDGSSRCCVGRGDADPLLKNRRRQTRQNAGAHSKPRRSKHSNKSNCSKYAIQTPPLGKIDVRPPFNASAYEVNYTITFAVSTGSITVTIEGWTVIGVGPFDNYSFGMHTVPLRGTATYKTVTMEGGATYTLARALDCYRVVEEGEWPFTSLIDGIDVTRTVLGQCQRLNYTGVLYEERGVLDPRALRRLLQEVSGNYTAYACEVNGAMLSADLVSTAIVYDASVRAALKMEAVKAGPYDPETCRQILQEIEKKLREELSD